MNPIIDAETSRTSEPPIKKKSLKMIYHFSRVLEKDITVEGSTEGECLDRALYERMQQCKPTAVKGEVVE